MTQRFNKSIEGFDAAQLRQAFDRTFALPPSMESQEYEDLLTIRVAGNPYAIRLFDITEIVTGRKIVSVPTTKPDLLGLAGIHGGIVPVFGLSSLLGYSHDPGPPRWLILCGTEKPVALAFSHFEGYLRLPNSALHADDSFHAKSEQVKYVNQIASTPEGTRAVISVPLIMVSIRNRISQPRPTKESSK